MKKWLSILSAASLLLYPFATFAVDYGSQASQTQQVPPVAQTLVREGDFAIKLAAELDLGNPVSEAEAEAMLAKAGIAPLNGWISDYPVTPEIIGQLKDSIAQAAAESKLPVTVEKGTQGLYNLAAQLNLPTPAGPGTTAPAAPSNPSYVDEYYYDQGPPIVTYYPPPVYYGYLYDWVPYPTFWFGFWFPGFFICHNFTTTVIVTHTAFVSRTAIVSNRIINPVTRTVVVVDPVVRTSTGTIRSVTALRTGSGQMFRTVADMRQGVNMAGVSSVRQETFTNTALRTEGFGSPEASKSAQAMAGRSAQALNGRATREGSIVRGQIQGQSQFTRPATPMRSFGSTVPPMMKRAPVIRRPSPGKSWHGRG